MNPCQRRNEHGIATLRNRRGVALPMMAMLAVVFLAFLGLVFDSGFVMWKKRTMQAAADAAAFDGAHEVLRNNTARIISAGKYSARLNGYEDGDNGILVAINRPPTSGPNQDNNHVEAIVSQTSSTFFLPILGINDAPVAARAVAGIHNSGEFCVLALDNVDDALTVTGNGGVTANCGFRSNSCVGDGQNSFRVQGSSSLTLTENAAGQLPTPVGCGDVLVKGAAETTPDLISDGHTEPDPFSGRTPPSPPGIPYIVDHPNINGTLTLNPGHYASTKNKPAVNIQGGNVTFNPGLYIFEGLSINGGTITANNVTFFVTGAGKTFEINGNATVTMTARTINDDPVKNQHILFWCDANFPGELHRFNGGASDVFSGVTYCPGDKVDWRGNFDINNANNWGMIVAGQIEFGGTSALNLNEPPAGVLGELGILTVSMKE